MYGNLCLITWTSKANDAARASPSMDDDELEKRIGENDQMIQSPLQGVEAMLTVV